MANLPGPSKLVFDNAKFYSGSGGYSVISNFSSINSNNDSLYLEGNKKAVIIGKRRVNNQDYWMIYTIENRYVPFESSEINHLWYYLTHSNITYPLKYFKIQDVDNDTDSYFSFEDADNNIIYADYGLSKIDMYNSTQLRKMLQSEILLPASVYDFSKLFPANP